MIPALPEQRRPDAPPRSPAAGSSPRAFRIAKLLARGLRLLGVSVGIVLGPMLLGHGPIGSLAQAQETARAPTPQRIGVLVLAGHEVRLLQIGVLVFGNAYGQAPAPDGRLADAIYAAVQADLEREPTQRVGRVPVPWVDLQRLSPLAHAGSSSFWGPSLSEIQGDLVRLAAGCACDTLLVLTTPVQAEVLGTNQTARGVTWIRTPGRQGLLVPLRMFVVDPATGRVRGHTHVASALPPVPAPWPLDPVPTPTVPAAAPAASEPTAPAAPPDRTVSPQPKTAWTDAEWTALVQAAPAALASAGPGQGVVHGLSLALSRIGLRPSCAMAYYELTTTRRQRDPAFADHVRPPAVAPGADPSLCPVQGAVGPG